MAGHCCRLVPRRWLVVLFVLAVCLPDFFYTDDNCVASAFSVPSRLPPNHRKTRSSSINKSKKNLGGNKNWYEKRKAGVKVTSRGPKPPKWEREGDQLYVNNNKEQQQQLISKKDMTYEQARQLLRSFEGTITATQESNKQEGVPTRAPKDDNDDDDDDDDKPFLWGSLSIGPVWKSRLIRAGYSKPTPIQAATYTALTNKKNQTSINGNAIIAAATGSGKSLAYLLPYLTCADIHVGKKKKTKSASVTSSSSLGRIWIMTPTMELAYQLQRTVDTIVVGSNGEETSHVLHVVEYHRSPKNSKPQNSDDDEHSFSDSYPILKDIIQNHYSDNAAEDNQEPTFLAGTPKLFLQLRKEHKKVLAATTTLDDSNDDDDSTEPLLYRRVALALQSNLQTLILDEVDRLLQTTTATTRREFQTTKPLAQELLEALVWECTPKIRAPSTRVSEVTRLQIVCASATIGRSLRKQLMNIVQAPSTDKAAALITADVRTKKNAEERKASLLPSNLQHSYRFLLPTSNVSESLHLTGLVETLCSGAPCASLVFPGKMGVEAVQEYLQETGFEDIRGISSLRNSSNNNDQDGDSDTKSWQQAPVYVVKERLARGLDLPFVKRVVLMSVPNNAAAYAHLAGRTARQNTPGECTTLSELSDTHKLLSIAETLGLTQWKCLNDDDEEHRRDHTPRIAAPSDDDEWDVSSMTKTAIRSKTVSELRSFLESQEIPSKGLLKEGLVDAVLALKTKCPPL